MEIHLVRHTQVDVTSEMCYGHLDVPLAGSFNEEIQSIINQIDKDYEAYYSSPLSRCKLLIEQLTSNGYLLDERLLECNFGDWEGNIWSEIEDDTLPIWFEEFVETRPPNGESLVEMQSRVEGFIAELLDIGLNKVLIVTHAGVLRLFYRYVLDFPLQNLFKISFHYGEILKLRIEPNSVYNKILN